MTDATRGLALWTAALLAFAAVLAGIGYAISHTLSTFILAFVLAYLLDPLVVLLERRGLGRDGAVIFLGQAKNLVGRDIADDTQDSVVGRIN